CATPCGTSKLMEGPLGSTKFTIKFTTKIHSESACADNFRCCATERRRRSVALQIDKVDDKANQAQGRRKNESTNPEDDKVIDKVNDEVPELQPIRVVCLEVSDKVRKNS